MDKRLNLILNLTEGPDSRTTADKVNQSLGEMYNTFEKVVQASKEERKLLQQLNAEEEKRNRILEQRARVKRSGGDTSNFDRAADMTSRRIDTMKGDLSSARSARASETAVLTEQRRAWEANTKIHEREEEKRAQNAIRAMKKQEKERDKFIRSAKGALDGLLSLAESAALAYASMMNIDESNVKKWLQWFAAIKSVGAGLKGIYDIYKSVHGVIKMIQGARTAEAAATALATAATSANTKAELANCAAKSCGLGGGVVAGGAAKSGFFGAAKGWAGAAGRGIVSAAKGIGAFATSTTGMVLGGVAAGFALGEGFNYLRTGETLTGAIGSTYKAWGDSNASADQLKNQRELQTRIRNRKSGFDMEMDLGVAERRRENRLYGAEQKEGFAGLYGTEAKRTSAGRAAEEEKLKALQQNEAELRSKGGTYASSATEERRAEGYKLLAQAEETLIQKLKAEIKIKKDALDEEMRAQEKQLANSQKYYDQSERWLDKATKKSNELNSKFDQMSSGLLGMSRGQAKRALEIRERMNQGDDSVTYRESELARRAGLVNTPEMEERARQAREREMAKRGLDTGYAGDVIEKRGKANKEKDQAQQNIGIAFDDLIIEQAITVDLKSDHEKQMDAMIDKLRPQLEEALKRRDEAIVKAFENERWKAMIQEEIDKLKQELEGNT